MATPRTDLIILGGGLAGGLAALALKARRPDVRARIIEPGPRIGGNHLWSFFDSDLDARGRQLVDPLVAHRWNGYSVQFPRYSRRIAQRYRTIESERLDAAVRAAGIPVIRASVIAVTPVSARLDNGETIEADAVLDARGLGSAPAGLHCGWQKFVGRLLTVPAGHGVAEPVVMDATVDQWNGYRFVYLLPFSKTQVFVEDTYYHDHPEFDAEELEGRIELYAASQGWQISSRDRAEQGVLPVLTGGNFDGFWPAIDKVARAGVRGGLFHPLTSYSLPDAVRFADWLSTEAPLNETLGEATRALAKAHWRRGQFDRLLARMLLKAARPERRYRVLQRFYRLPEPLIARFYAGRSTALDRTRILLGRPPVPLHRALLAVIDR